MKTIKEGSFWEHLDELRRRLFIILIVLLAASFTAFILSRHLMELVLETGPNHLQTLSPTEGISAHLMLSLIAGVIVTSPLFSYQFWRFISPGLYKKEKRVALASAGVSTLLFITGAVFAWLVMLKPATTVFQSFETGSILGNWSLSNYISFLGRFLLVFGIAFQIPIVVFLLVKLGVVSPDGLSKYRKHIIIGLLIVAAVLTPPDPLTQVMLALPLYILFEVSLLAARIGNKKQKRESK